MVIENSSAIDEWRDIDRTCAIGIHYDSSVSVCAIYLDISLFQFIDSIVRWMPKLIVRADAYYRDFRIAGVEEFICCGESAAMMSDFYDIASYCIVFCQHSRFRVGACIRHEDKCCIFVGESYNHRIVIQIIRDVIRSQFRRIQDIGFYAIS